MFHLLASESFAKTISEKESNIASLNQRLQGKLLEFEKREEVLQGGEILATHLEKGFQINLIIVLLFCFKLW